MCPIEDMGAQSECKGVTRERIIDYLPFHSRSVLLAGTVRSGTTWTSAVINYNNAYRYMFEPFYPDLECCNHFRPRPFLLPENRDPVLLTQAGAIFSGRVRHQRVDQFNKRTLCRKRLIKVIHCNLMLKWIRTHFPEMKIVLLVRHPCAVVHSLLRLGWDPALKHLLCQENLMSGILSPFRTEMERAASPFEEHLFLWCAETYVALQQLAPDDACLVFYEQLCENPEAEIARMFAFLGQRYDRRVLAQLKLPSPLSRPDSTIITGGSLIDSWRAGITAEQLARAMEVVRLFGLDRIYSDEAMPNVQAAYEIVRTSCQSG